MKISEIAKLSGLNPSRIRFYEAQGLLKAIHRKANGYREYSEDTLTILSIIISAQQAGFSLEEIRSVMPTNLKDWKHDELVFMLKKKILEIQNMEQKLMQSRMHLEAVLHGIESKPNDMTCSENAEKMLADLT